MSASKNLTRHLRRASAIVAKGVFEVTHNSFALIGIAVLFTAITLVARPELRQLGEIRLFSWLQERQTELVGFVSDPIASERATAANPKELPKQQAAVTFWLSKKYRVAPEPLSALVAEAYDIGARAKLEPTLILAIMAIESGFNPFAQSPVGAQGLMQVMTRVHSDKYESFGGKFAAFDPVSNLRVGVKVLQDCIKIAGSVEGGLRYYVGAANIADDGGYVGKVLAEHSRLQQVALGRPAPITTPTVVLASPKPVDIPTPTATDGSPVELPQPEPEKAATVAMN